MVLTLGVLAAGACGDDPAGPGTWTGTVRSSTAPAGAVVLQVRGEGIRSIEAFGGVEAVAHRTVGTEDGSATWRVVLLTGSPGSMAFRVRVTDLDRGAPRAVVLSAVDGANEPIPSLASFSVEMER